MCRDPVRKKVWLSRSRKRTRADGRWGKRATGTDCRLRRKDQIV